MRNARESDLVSSKPCLFQSIGLVLKPSPVVQCVCWVQAPENKHHSDFDRCHQDICPGLEERNGLQEKDKWR